MSPHAFEGTDRFEVRDVLGRGAFGVVYRAFDRELGREVALKTLPRLDPTAVRELKQEFRAAADLRHPNLVELYDLVVDGDRCFFTMELLEGPNLIEAALRARTPEGLVLRVLPDIIAGLSGLHEAGILHRDLKPSNVHVTEDGGVPRAKLLDFGLAAPTSPDADGEAEVTAGTIEYMPPEQIAGQAPTPASDWYALGVTLFEVLAGTLPFPSDVGRILEAKARVPIEEIEALDAPAWSKQLIAALLAPDAADRPSGDGIARQLESHGLYAARAESRPGRRLVPWAALDSGESAELVGRERELATLQSIRDAQREGGAHVVHVAGPSGMGKTELVRQFLSRAQAAAGTMVLHGRCHPQELVPYKAFDQVIDNLAAELPHLGLHADEWVGGHASDIVRLFPVLASVLDVADAPSRDADPHEARRRASRGLRDLIGGLASATNLIVWIDDLQWSDLDSGFLLREFLREPDPPSVVWILSYRSDDEGTADFAKLLPEADTRSTRIDIGPLDPGDGSVLVERLFDGAPERLRAAAARIVEESEGSPFWIRELSRYFSSEPDVHEDLSPPGVGDVVGRRLARLSSAERSLLELLAIAGKPLERGLLLEAAALDRRSLPLLGGLQKICLTRTSGGERERVQTYHDKIGEFVVGDLDAESRMARHLSLAEALSRRPDSEPESLVEHYLGAQRTERAAVHAVRAGERAASALAFERAAEMYELALRHSAADVPRLPLRRSLADALSHAGRGRQAAAAYEQAAREAADPTELVASDLRRTAAEHLLKCGAIDEGLDRMRSVLGELGVRMPRTAGEAMLRTGWNRLRIGRRGTRITPRARPLTDREHARLDALWSASIGVGMVDTALSFALAGDHLLFALDAADPSRLCVALGHEAAVRGSLGTRWLRPSVRRTMARARMLAAETSHPYDEAWTTMASGIVAWTSAQWPDAVSELRTALDLYRRNCPGKFFEVANTNIWLLAALAFTGEVRELVERVREELDGARARGDIFAENGCLLGEPILAALAQDRAEQALADADAAIAGFSSSGVFIQHYHHLLATVQCHLYLGDGWGAWRRILAGWPALRRNGFMLLEVVACELRYLRARAALMAASDPGDRPSDLASWSRSRLVRVAEAEATRLARSPQAFGDPLAEAVHAMIALQSGDEAKARVHLRAAGAAFDRESMALHREAIRFVAGTLDGRDASTAKDAAAWMRDQGIERPDAIVATLLACRSVIGRG